MWASGKLTFPQGRRPLGAGGRAAFTSHVHTVAKKGFEEGNPIVFMTRKMLWQRCTADKHEKVSEEDAAILEERTHVFLTEHHNRTIREGQYVSFFFLAVIFD